MTITLIAPDGARHAATLPYPDAIAVAVAGLTCPGCKAPLRVNCGAGSTVEDYATESGPARCAGCRVKVGTLEVEHNTMFGIAEDRRIYCGPWRVF